MVKYCTLCGNDGIALDNQGRWKCPNCGSYGIKETHHEDDDENDKEE